MSLMKFRYLGLEYQQNGTFVRKQFEIRRSDQTWNLYRENELLLSLPVNQYTVLKVIYCGICSTDSAIQNFPFGLPLITGHEIVGLDVEDNRLKVTDINATHHSCNDQHSECDYCNKGDTSMHVHCPKRMTIGIDRMPGGFAEFILVPKNAIDVPTGISPKMACFTEPFAAALHSLDIEKPREGDRVAINGVGKLGLFILAALLIYRDQHNLNFEISAICRNQLTTEICKKLGVDNITTPEEIKQNKIPQYDIIFDTSGSIDGFETSLQISKRSVHLKSTNGEPFYGVNHLTQFVVDEMSLCPFSEETLTNFQWQDEPQRAPKFVFVSPNLQHTFASLRSKFPSVTFVQMDPVECFRQLLDKNFVWDKNANFGKFDAAILSSLSELDLVVRPVSGMELSLVREKGLILLHQQTDSKTTNHLENSLKRGVRISSSRCGNLENTLTVMKDHLPVMQILEKHMITHVFGLSDMEQAFDFAKSKKGLKVLVSPNQLSNL